ncbi:izumo sperm-egg fusion protein 4 isoform X2 [Perognathus longimembris pacificus]|uniref:izumo sperm-egg fusion protein 4 isoform X2 n=1 Tax=Perognathus longimembris pacificus TaxID=214514 RepID=UPI002018F75E|nr:izumo sperm-egg fusion protein 4 isoform X2 [Perognathus longimembris pacificus]
MTPLVGARLEGVALAAPLVGGRRRAMALLLCLGMAAALARGCLHCNGNFSEKFSFYRHHVNLKSWWVGDIPVSGALLTEWSQDTMKELHLAIPAEITREKLDQVAEAVYQRLDQLYQGKMYFPGYFPNELRTIFRDQVHLIQNAIIESRIDCQRHCEIIGTKYQCENHPSLPDIPKLHLSGAPASGQPDFGKCLRVFDPALTRPCIRPQQGPGFSSGWTGNKLAAILNFPLLTPVELSLGWGCGREMGLCIDSIGPRQGHRTF